MASLMRIKHLASSPEYTRRHLMSVASPKFYYNKHSRRSKIAGISQPSFVLSFDCDTVDDIAVVESVHSRIREMGIQPVYAVPGELLREGSAVYKEIMRDGSEFINHGGRRHTFFNTALQREESCFFYDQQSSADREEDVRLGHKLVLEVLGVEPTGFRTPHFGTFSKVEDLKWLHELLVKMEYRYSSSATPFWGDKCGPKYLSSAGQLIEFPISGGFGRPLTILDSWRAFGAPNRSMTPSDYFDEVKLLASHVSQLESGLINIYADPLHIAKEPLFFEAMSELAKVVKPTTFSRLLERQK